MTATLVDATVMFARRLRPRLVETRGGPVEVAVTGNGPAVLAIHGGLGGYDQGLRVAAAALGVSRHTIVAVSRPGYLGTPLAAGTTPHEQADLFADVLDALGIAEATVMAISAGGPSALQFALRHRERCRALVLISACTGPLRVRLRPPIRVLRFLARWPGLVATLLRRLGRDPERMAAWLISDPAARDAIRRDEEAKTLLIELQRDILDRLTPRVRGTEHDLRLFATLPELPLDRIAVPVLAFHGTADEIVSFSHARNLTARLPGADVIGIAGGEHVCLFTHREVIRARVRDFLSEWSVERRSRASLRGR